MADFTLTLGGVQFKSFEIPDSIKAGGAQVLETHKYGGGQRSVDAFGPDDDAISWQGAFLDSDAEARCQQLDSLRKAGAPVDLSFGSFSYSVVIKAFTFDYTKFYWINYSLSLEVVTDNVQPNTEEGDDPESDMQGDLDDASDYSDAMDDSGFTSPLDTVTGDLSGVQSITGGSVPFLTQFSSDISSAASYATNLSNTLDTEVSTLGLGSLYASGTNPATMAANLLSLSSAATELPNAFGAANTMTKLGKSVASILSGG